MSSDSPGGTGRIVASRAEPIDGPALIRFFERCSSNCYCRYWHFSGDKNDWLDRCANRPDENRDEALRSLNAVDRRTIGVVARDDGSGAIVGWSQLGFAEDVPKILEQRYYRGLACLKERRREMMVVLCMLVLPSHRRLGVARALVGAAIHEAAVSGAEILIALPRVSAERVTDEELWLGPYTTYIGLGFKEIHAERPYPVLSLDLVGTAPSPLRS